MGNEGTVYPVTLSLETIFELMSERRRRYTLYVLAQLDEEGIYLDTFATHLAQLEATDDYIYEDSAKTYLQEQCLPTLIDVGLIDYDPRTQAIRYWQNASLEEWVEHAAFKEDKAEW